jgi:hypothetical protein
MAIFTFTVNCPVTPTPTPTPEPTPCPCDEYFIENVGGSPRTVSYSDCRGITRSTPPIAGGNAITLCACSVTPQTNIVISNLGPCPVSPTPTPTPTSQATPTPTVTNVPTVTPVPNYTVTVYASLEAIPNAIIPPGSGTEATARVYYWLGFPSVLTLLGGNITSTSCNLVGTVSNIPEKTVFNIGMRSWSYNTPIFFIPNLGSSTCINTGQTYCGTAYDSAGVTIGGGGYSFTVTGNTTIALTAKTIIISQYVGQKKVRRTSDPKSIGGTIDVYENRTSLYYCNNWTPPNNT